MMRFKSYSQVREGFTLFETIIYIALVGAAFSALGLVYTSGLKSQAIANAQQTLLETEQLVGSHMQARLEETDSIIAPASGTDTTLTVSSPDSADDPVTFSLLDGALMMQLGAQDPEPLTPSSINVTEFTVERLQGDPASVYVTITYEVPTFGGSFITKQTTSTYALRFL